MGGRGWCRDGFSRESGERVRGEAGIEDLVREDCGGPQDSKKEETHRVNDPTRGAEPSPRY